MLILETKFPKHSPVESLATDIAKQENELLLPDEDILKHYVLS